jgi:NO-binding membrane sensor protein with MHYT domain
MTTIISAFIAVLALSVIVAVLVAVIASWQRQRIRRESRALDEMLFRKEDEEE